MKTRIDFVGESFEYDRYLALAEYAVKEAYHKQYIKSLLEELEHGVNENSKLLLEADGEKMLDNFKEFFKDLWNLFMNKVTELSNKNAPWVKENTDKLNNLNYDGFEVSILPYWKTGYNEINKVREEIKKRGIDMSKRVDDGNWTGDMDELKANMYKDYANSDGEFAKGLANYLRGGNPDKSEKIILKGNDLKERVGGMIEYCKNYKNIAKQLATVKSKIESDITYIEKGLQSMDNIKESSLLLEAIYLLFEEDNKVEVKTSDNKDKDTSSDENKEDDRPVEEKPKETSSKDASENEKSNNKLKKQIVNLETDIYKKLITTTMTFLEEKHNIYMRTLKMLLGKTNSDKKDSEEESNE